MRKVRCYLKLLTFMSSIAFSAPTLSQSSSDLSPLMISAPALVLNDVFDEWKSYISDFDPLVINSPDCITGLTAASSRLCLQENLSRLNTRLDEILIFSSTVKLTMYRDNPSPEGENYTEDYDHIYSLDTLIQTWKTAVHFQCQFESLDYHFSEDYPVKQLQCLEHYTYNFLTHLLTSLELGGGKGRAELVRKLSAPTSDKGLISLFGFRRALLPKEFLSSLTSDQLDLYPCSEINGRRMREICDSEVRQSLEEDVKNLTYRLAHTYRQKRKAAFVIFGMDSTWRAVALSECEFSSNEVFSSNYFDEHVSICFTEHLKIRAEYLKSLLRDE